MPRGFSTHYCSTIFNGTPAFNNCSVRSQARIIQLITYFRSLIKIMKPSDVSITKVKELMGHKAAVYALDWHPELELISAGGNGWIVQWDLETGDGHLIARIEDRIFSLAHYENYILAGTMSGNLIVLEKKGEKWEPRVIQAHTKGLYGIQSTKDGFITGGGDGFLCQWDKSLNQTQRIQLAQNSIRNIQLHPDKKVVAVSTSSGKIHFLNIENLEAAIPPFQNAHEPSVFCTSWLDGGKQLISGGRDALLKIWKFPDFEPTSQEINAHLYTINSIAQHPDENLLATGSRDRTIKIWDRSTFALLKVIDFEKYGGHVNSVNNLYWTSEGLFSAGDDRKVIHWEIETAFLGTPKSDLEHDFIR